jgi:hypothetical protein
MPLDAASLPLHSLDLAPFGFAEQAWLWTSHMLTARRRERRLSAERLICGHAPGWHDDGDRSDYCQRHEALERLKDILPVLKTIAGFSFGTGNFNVGNFPSAADSGNRQQAVNFRKNKSMRPTSSLTQESTTGSISFEANRVGSLIADCAASVSWPCTTKLLPLAVISPPNPDQLGVAPIGATPLFFLCPRGNSTLGNPTYKNKEI